jgi:hypothetical protein
MVRKRIEISIDPATGKPLPDGIGYRGPGQYRARKLVDGRRFIKTFASARIAARWLTGVEVAVGDRGAARTLRPDQVIEGRDGSAWSRQKEAP